MSLSIEQAISNLILLMKDELNQLATFIDAASKVESSYQAKFNLLKNEALEVKETISQERIYTEEEACQVMMLMNGTKQLMADALTDDDVNRDYMNSGLVEQLQQIIDDMKAKIAVHQKTKVH